jgi:hypothetical protein
MPTISTLTVDIQSRTSGFSRGLKVATAGLAALATGAAYAFGKFEESENVMQQTDAVIKSTGKSAHVSAKEVQDLADALSEKTGVDDEVIQSGENMLLTFKNIQNVAGENNDIFTQASKATLDMAAGMAAATGGEIDLKSASIQVGKALNDPIAGMSALSRVGVTFDEGLQRQIQSLVKHGNTLGAQKIILAELTSEFQGSAKASKTTAGTVSVAFENLAEIVGGLLAPAIRTLADGLTGLIEFLQQSAGPAWESFSTAITNAYNAARPFFEAIGGVLIPLLETAWHTIQDRIIPVFMRLKPLWIALGVAFVLFATVIVAQVAIVVTAIGFIIDKFLDLVGFVRDKVVEPIVNFLARIGDFLGKVAGWIRDRFLEAWRAVRGPVLAVLRAIGAALGVVIRIIGKVIGWVKDRFLEAWRAVKGPIGAVIGFIVGLIERIIMWIGRAISWVKEHFGGAWQAVKETVGAVVGPIVGFIGQIIDKVATLVGWIKTAVEWFGNLGSQEVPPPGAPHLNPPQAAPNAQHGGLITRGGLVNLHAGEVVTPARAMPGTVVVRLDRKRFVEAYDYEERYRGF